MRSYEHVVVALHDAEREVLWSKHHGNAVARSGLQRLFVGNTAQRLIHNLCDVDLLMIPSSPD